MKQDKITQAIKEAFDKYQGNRVWLTDDEAEITQCFPIDMTAVIRTKSKMFTVQLTPDGKVQKDTITK
jgi:hypothetical protein